MNSVSKIGVGLVVLIALCCAGPLVLSLVVSGAVLGALSAIWATTARYSPAVVRCLSRSALGFWRGAKPVGTPVKGHARDS